MKFWAFAAFITGVAVVTFAVRKHQHRFVTVPSKTDQRYDIYELPVD